MGVKRLRIGVDVGGHKAPTTTNPSLGINDALVSMFEQSKINPDDVASVTIGTTHFVNAVVERDAARLSRVAVIRLSGPFGKHAPPCVDWPEDMRSLILGHYALVKGGLEVDGRPISDIDSSEIRSVCAAIAAKSITAVVINGIFSPIDVAHSQEARAAAIVRAALPGADVVQSRDVAQLGFLERENGAVLNASILAFARKTIRSFRRPVARLGLRCPVFVTQNDGTILSGEAAARLPIRTFSSGPTNSMRGAAFLVAGERSGEAREPMMVVDVGGTTTDVGLLLANGFPRQAAAFSEFAGVRMNFSCPDVKSIGLGGGSLVRRSPHTHALTIGPDSVGYAIQTAALCFGGTVPTATDYTVAGDASLAIGTHAAAARAAIPPAAAREHRAVVARMLEAVVDAMKTAPGDLPVVLVGGGAVVAPDVLRGASRVYEKAGGREEVAEKKAGEKEVVDFEAYRPRVEDRVWYISETDLAWISTGCYILGTGGGGSPYSSMLRLRSMLRAGAVVKVVSPDDLKDDDRVGCGGGAGSPTVGIEKLAGDEMMEAQDELYSLVKDKATHMIALEIGGGNGLQGMILGASTNMNIPTVDGDWMGRAYPTKWQTTPVVFAERNTIFCPSTMCDGNGNVVFMTKATSDETVERVFRAGLSELGSHVGCAEGPVTGAETKRWAVEHTISLSWRIGRAVHKARHSNRIDNVAESIVEEVGGSGSAKVLFKGKIIGVERTLRNGHVYGEVIIEAADINDDGSDKKEFEGKVKIPFKNENIAAFKVKEDGSEETLAIVPDLISCIDAQNGEAIGTPEYRYGLLVIVLGITASERWTSTARGVELGGPKAFGLDNLEYKPIGKFEKPMSVIDEYSK
ncbi:putative hydantoinase protein [Neofusicoccum parvum UCRNP2]|uniref:Putative hydantoinase protein n=1 Tax=Botryosphaeria parva (strain UCR-NP2) TaxID=1287680 RepID=R1GST3_BOTPV|nr:putative hydantoinase protein [Neofusicoccum parvum UCRNP2]